MFQTCCQKIPRVKENGSKGFLCAPSITVPSPKIIIGIIIVFSGSQSLFLNPYKHFHC